MTWPEATCRTLRRRRRAPGILTIIAGTIVALTACARPSKSPNPAPGEPLLTSDSTRYVAHVDGARVTLRIGYRYTNRTRGPIYIPGCYGPGAPRLEFLRDSQWVPAYLPITLMCRDQQTFAVARDSTYESSFQVRGGPLESGAQGEWTGTLPGTYRLVLRAYSSDSLYAVGDSLPSSASTSNTFFIDR
jgi:hypothetical protein